MINLDQSIRIYDDTGRNPTYQIVDILFSNDDIIVANLEHPEFDVNTKWMYKSDDGLQLAVCNDANMVRAAAAAYLKAKTGNR